MISHVLGQASTFFTENIFESPPQHCKEVLGVEIIEEAIEDAKFNAENNDISNCTFYAGNCDDFINSLVHQATSKDILAIIDPPRAGLREYSR